MKDKERIQRSYNKGTGRLQRQYERNIHMEIIQIRLDPQTLFFYKAQAEAKNLPLSTYLRQRLKEQDHILEEYSQALEERLDRIEQEIQKLMTKETKESSLKTDFIYEVLLLLRSASNPSQLQMVHAELERQGREVWEGPV